MEFVMRMRGLGQRQFACASAEHVGERGVLPVPRREWVGLVEVFASVGGSRSEVGDLGMAQRGEGLDLHQAAFGGIG